jgi:hypothetical protein
MQSMWQMYKLDGWLPDGSEAQLAAESLVVSRLVGEDAGQNVV